MPKASVKRLIECKKKDLIDLVLDIEKYPEFVPFCFGAKIYENKNEGDLTKIIADLTIGKGPFKDTYKSDVIFDRKKDSIFVKNIEGPLNHLSNNWIFVDKENGITEVTFDIPQGVSSEHYQVVQSMGNQGFNESDDGNLIVYFQEKEHPLFLRNGSDIYLSISIGYHQAVLGDKVKIPTISVIIGEGGSGGAIGIATSDRVLMLEHSIYSVISPEGCASILWRDSSKVKLAAESLKLTAQDLKNFGIIDEIISEPLGGAHRDPESIAADIKFSIIKNLKNFESLSRDEIYDHRKSKFLQIGRDQGFSKSSNITDGGLSYKESVFNKLKSQINKNKYVYAGIGLIAIIVTIALLS